MLVCISNKNKCVLVNFAGRQGLSIVIAYKTYICIFVIYLHITYNLGHMFDEQYKQIYYCFVKMKRGLRQTNKTISTQKEPLAEVMFSMLYL